MRNLLSGVALGLLSACQYQANPDVPDASGPFVGNVTLTWAPTSTGVTANFTEPQFVLAGCAGTQVGSCCAYAQPALMDGEEPITVSAGTIAVDDGAAVLGAFGFEGIGYVPLSSAETPSLTWNPGDTLSIAADGGLVGPFTGSIVAPVAFSGVTPNLNLTGQVVVPLSHDFTATWNHAPAANATVTLSLFDPSGFYVDCTVDDSAGTVTAPTQALSSFLSGDDGYVTLTRAVSQMLQPVDATVTLTAEATAPGLAHFE